MQIEDSELFRFMQDTSSSLARLEEGQRNQTDHLEAVSRNGRSTENKLTDHEKDDGAHGLKTLRAASNMSASWLTVILTAIGTLVGIAAIATEYRFHGH